MNAFAKTLADKVEGYITLRRSLGYAFRKQAAILRALARYVEAGQLDGPLTREMAHFFSARAATGCRRRGFPWRSVRPANWPGSTVTSP